MRSYSVVAAALLARCLAEPIRARSDDGESAPTDITVSSVIIVTIQKQALTTTFTAPSTCYEERLTQQPSPGFQIWLNEPVPVPGSTMGDCYPSEFMQDYRSLSGSSSSVAPIMSPLVCPHGWEAVSTWSSSYIACCHSGWGLALPSTGPIDPARPAYGGTCYSNFQSGQSAIVTKYDSEGNMTTGIFRASTSVDQAYGHPIDGIALSLMTTSASTRSNIITQPPETSTSPNDPSQNTDGSAAGSGSRGLQGGAIAGIVVGSVAAVSFIILGAFLFVRRRAKKQGHEQIGGFRDQPSQQTDHTGAGDKPLPNVYPLKDHPANGSIYTASSPVHAGADARSDFGTATTIASPVSELGGQQRHELATVDYAELDGGYHRHEMHS